DTLGGNEDFAFHYAISEATGIHFFCATLMAIRDQMATGIDLNRNLSLIQSRQRKVTVQNEHTAIYAAIAARDESAARLAMRDHIEQARKRIFEGEDRGVNR